MNPKTTVVLAPALAGKTTWLMDRYARAIARPGRFGDALWLAPNHRVAEEIRACLIERGLSACLRPNCLTFAQFAEVVINAANAPLRPLDALEKRQIVRGLILRGVSAKKLIYFEPIAGTDGLVDLVCDLFSDLKRQEIWPEELHRICQSRGNRQKDCELANLYEQYQEILNKHGLYDPEGRFWYARDLLRHNRVAQFQKLAMIVVDGFADFTRTQHEILSLLRARTDELFVSLPWEEGRGDLFHKSHKTLSELERRLPDAVRVYLPRRPVTQTPSFARTLAHIEESLFCDPRETNMSESASGLEILAASGQTGEVELLARTIKRLLVEGDFGNRREPVRPGEIVVVYRSTSGVAPLVREIFGEYGIPFAIDSRSAVGEAPLIRALLGALKLQIEDWPFRGLLQLLLNNYFRPPWPEWRGGNAAFDVEKSVRSLQIPRGRDSLLSALQRRSSAELEAGADDRRRERKAAAGMAFGVLERLAASYARLPGTATAAEWSLALAEFGGDLGLLATPSGEDAAITKRDTVAWEILQRRLQDSTQLEIRLNGKAEQLDLRAIADRVQQIGRFDVIRDEYDEVGRVRVLSAPAARAIRVPFLFLAGLSEKSFPASAGDHRIYSAAEHREMNRAGSRFVERHERACEEMLLFYEIITRATRRLWLSYSALDEAAEPLSPSPYLTEIQQLFNEGAIDRTEAPDLSPVPVDDEPCCQRDLRIKAIAMAIDGSPRLAARLFAQPRAQPVCDSLRHAFSAQAQRSKRDRFGVFEGMLLDPLATQQLREQFGSEHCWSTSQLEQYGECPYRFLLRHVLKLRQLDDLSLETDALLRGRRVHSFFAELHRQLNGSGTPCLPSECETETFEKLVADTLAAVIRRTASSSLLESALDEIDHLLIARWVQKYLDQWQEYEGAFSGFDQPPRPMHFEVSFGPAKDDGTEDEVDPISKPVAYELNCNGVSIRLAGRIDRIDIGIMGGQVVFNILDYKTSDSQYYRPKDITELKALQLPLYAMAVEDLLLAETKAIPWHGGYWHVRDEGFKAKRGLNFHEQNDGALKRTELWTDLRERIVERVGRLVAGVRAGEFPMHCEDEKCTGRCEYKTVCRVNAVRSLEKSWQPPPLKVE